MRVLAASIVSLSLVAAGQCAGQEKNDVSATALQGPGVVFFGPTKAEGDSIARAEGMDIADMLDEFDLASGKTAVYLGSKKIPYQFTTKRSILVKVSSGKVWRFDRKAIPDLVGMILSDGVQEPRSVSGSGEANALIHQVNDFFRIPEPPKE